MAGYNKPDHWTLKAQKEAYPARSVYKLLEMDEKFGLVKGGASCFKVLDLGAAPGSWSLYVLRKLLGRAGTGKEKPFLLVSVDLCSLSDQGLFGRAEFCFIKGDFTLGQTREAILSRGPYNLIMSDAAPATTGNRSLDTLRSLELAESAFSLSQAALIRAGNLVLKVFQGGDTGTLLKTLRSQFTNAKSFKPKACRPESFETYYLGLGKK